MSSSASGSESLPRRRTSCSVSEVRRASIGTVSPLEAIRSLSSLLACPHCGAALTRENGSLRCPAGHSFDIARQGHVTLLRGDAHPDAGDTQEMLDARETFLAAGHYAPIDQGLADAAEAALADGPPGPVVDIGAGTGHYLAKVLERLPGREGIALDISPAAAKRAAKQHTAVVCDIWDQIPVETGAAALALNVFSPRNGAEMRRILNPAGALLVVSPTERHLQELIAPHGLLNVDERKAERIENTLNPHFDLAGSTQVEFGLELGKEDLVRLVAMGPSARHAPSPAARAARTTVSVNLATYRPRP
jgi:23S rRNA (guanine745-N1)-methyltransferase